MEERVAVGGAGSEIVREPAEQIARRDAVVLPTMGARQIPAERDELAQGEHEHDAEDRTILGEQAAQRASEPRRETSGARHAGTRLPQEPTGPKLSRYRRAVSLGKRPLVTIDARMLHATGIGTYVRALVPRVIERLGDARFCLLGEPARLEREGLGASERVLVRRLTAGIYAPSEQPGLLLRTPKETRVFWSPHVNVPIVGPGRLLVTVHDVFYANPPRGAEPRWDKQLYLDMMHRGLRARASAIACDSEFTKSELVRLLGPFRCPLHAVPIGIESSWFERPPGARPHPVPYLLFVGNLKPHKNLPRTLGAFAEIAARVPHDFLVVGPGDAELVRAAVPAELRPRVHFLGVVDDARLKLTMAHASGLVLASLYEGFGLPPLEAMALGVPTLVARAASLPEVCGDAALYCDPESVTDIARGLFSLLTDESERARLVEQGRERARRFDWDACADRTSGILRGLL